MPDDPTTNEALSGVTAEPAAASTVDPTAMVKFKAAGVDREMTIEEALGYASKGFGADARFREADELRKSAESKIGEAAEALRWKDLLTKTRGGDLEAFRELANDWEVPAESIEEMVAAQTGTAPATGSGGAPEGTPSAYGLSPAQLADFHEMQRVVNGWKKAGIDPVKTLQTNQEFQDTSVKASAKEYVKKYLQSDPIFGKMVKDPTQGQTILDDVWKRVNGRVKAGTHEFTQETIRDATQELAAILNVFAETTGSGQPGNTMNPGSLGGAPSSTAGLSRLHPPKEPQMKDYEGDTEKYFLDKLAYRQHLLDESQ